MRNFAHVYIFYFRLNEEITMKKYLLTVFLLMAAFGVQAADFETAFQAVKNMKVGWNMGNTLEANNQSVTDIKNDRFWGQQGLDSETCWGQSPTKPDLLKMMKGAGFGAIRVPVTWYNHMDKNGNVDPAWMARVHQVVDYVMDQGLYCIINVHHDTGADSYNSNGSLSHYAWIKADMDNYNANKERYEKLWKQIAEEFKDYGQRLLFESYNEMLDSKSSWCFASFNANNKYDATIARSAYDAINAYAQSFVSTVRATGGNNAQRNLVVNTYGSCSGSGSWNPHLTDPLSEMKLPTDQVANHIIFQVHTYLNVSNLDNVKNEIDDMIAKQKKYLVAKGAPVIFGEWGTSNVDATVTDYDSQRENVLAFARYFVERCKANDMGTFYWMGLSNGIFRSYPAFNQPDLAKAILQAYYGNSYEPYLPVEDDYDVLYTVSYTGQYQELNLCNHQILISEYKGIRLEMKETPASNLLQIKVYSQKNSGGHYYGVSTTSTTTTVDFNASTMGSSINRITLQYMQSANYQAKVSRVVLLKRDGTEEAVTPDVFWGCSVSVEATLKPTAVPAVMAEKTTTDNNIYNLSGQRVAVPRKGIYIINGKKVVVR